ncbi:aminopeptidase N [Jatrophihabitans telluris]|uniref:Aminopeptidase N n=1 Tax=Jatrophihabitans telluris TaxID=2038343 RepID=A0ABY4R228_9ACTN|nr:aminopeptidase N [Jatrophihabitans telluris]UQX89981.1 aminopeptidase N [Jatrophihabitans telluris]
MASLTRVEALDRASLLAVESYDIDLDLTENTEEFSSHTTIRFGCTSPGAQSFLDVKADRIVRAELNGRRLDPTSVSDGRLQLSELAADNELVVEARMRYSSDGEGLHRHIDPADGQRYLYAMSFLDAGPRWFACFDQPDLKARYRITVACPQQWIVLGNGAATSTAPGRWQIAETQPLSTYFVTLVAGPYTSVTAEHDGIRLGMHARASLADQLRSEAPEMLALTGNAFDRYHDLFAIRYPFGEYHQVFCPDFNAGAMENPGCVTLRDQYVFRSAVTSGERGIRANTIVHEMAHMWFGDLVTMRWWDDLWLNESFAEYMAHRICAEITDYGAWTEFGSRRKDWGYVADQSPSTHPVAGNGSADAASALADFDGISYAKGAAALKQLAAHLGDDVFFSGLRQYFARHAYGNAEFSDLIDAWTAAGGKDVADWAKQWLTTTGLDTLTAAVSTGRGAAGAPVATLRVSRSSPDDSRRPHTVTAAGYDQDGHRRFSAAITVTADSAEVSLTEPGLADADLRAGLILADAEDDTWAKIRFSGGWSQLTELLARLDEPVARVVGYNAVRDGVRDAELSPDQALHTMLACAEIEDSDLVLTDLFGFAVSQLAGPFRPEADRPPALALVAETAQRLLDGSVPGGDRQLVAARAFVRSSRDAALLADWLEGRHVPDGLRVDAELRWLITARLAALGRIGEHEISAELDRDRSSAGLAHAARARSSRPDPEAKRWAWNALTRPGELSAYELYAVAEGFFEPGQAELTQPYVERFFTEMPDTVSFRTGWALARIVLLGYPRHAATPATVELAGTALARVDLDQGVRRCLVDATDELSRALRAIERFG